MRAYYLPNLSEFRFFCFPHCVGNYIRPYDHNVNRPNGIRDFSLHYIASGSGVMLFFISRTTVCVITAPKRTCRIYSRFSLTVMRSRLTFWRTGIPGRQSGSRSMILCCSRPLKIYFMKLNTIISCALPGAPIIWTK